MRILPILSILICLCWSALADDLFVFGSADQNTAYTFMSRVGGPLLNKTVEKVVYTNVEQSMQNIGIALTTDGEIYGWGANWGSVAGYLPEWDDGAGSGPIPFAPRNVMVPTRVTDRLNSTAFFGNSSFKIVDVSFGYTDGYRWSYAFLTSLNEIWTWGIPYGNHLGTGATTLEDTPRRVETPIQGPWKQIIVGSVNTFAARSAHMLAVSSNGVLIGWGSTRSCSLGIQITGEVPPSIIQWYRTLDMYAPEIAKVSSATRTAICTVDGELYLTQCSGPALRIPLPGNDGCRDVISFARGHRVITLTGRLYSFTDTTTGTVLSAWNGLPLANSDRYVIFNAPNHLGAWDFVYTQRNCSNSEIVTYQNCTSHEFWMRFSSDLKPFWPGRFDQVDQFNGWLRGTWTPPGDIFAAGNIRQMVASVETVGVLLRNGSLISFIHPSGFFQQGIQALGTTDEHNVRGKRLEPPAGVTFEKFFVTDNPGVGVATDGRVYRWTYFDYWQSYAMDEIPIFRDQPSKVAHISIVDGYSKVIRFENGSLYLQGYYCARMGVGLPCTDNAAADFELKRILIPEPVVVSWVWMAATSNGTIYAWGDMSPTGDESTPSIMPRGDIPEGHKIIQMVGYNYGDMILMVTDAGNLYVSGKIDSALMGRQYWLNFVDSPLNSVGPRLVPTAPFFNASILRVETSWDIIAVVTNTSQLWVVTRAAWVFPYDEFPPDPNVWYHLDPSGQGWPVLDVRVSDYIMALVENPSAVSGRSREWWVLGNNLCSFSSSWASKTATGNLRDAQLKNWTRIDTSGALFGRTIKDIQLYHPTWGCGTYFITAPFSVVENSAMQVRDPSVLVLQTFGLGRVQQSANVSVTFSGACSSSLTCSEITLIDTESSSSVQCRLVRSDVASFCSQGQILAQLTVNNVSASVTPIATRLAPPAIAESLVPIPRNSDRLKFRVSNVRANDIVEIRFNLTDVLCVPPSEAEQEASGPGIVICQLRGPSMTGPALGAQIRIVSTNQSTILTSSWYPINAWTTVATLSNAPVLIDRSGITQFPTILPVSSQNITLRASGLGSDLSAINASIGGVPCASIAVNSLVSDSSVLQNVVCTLRTPLRTTGTVLGVVSRSGGRSSSVPVALLEPDPLIVTKNVNLTVAENIRSLSIAASFIGTDPAQISVLISGGNRRRGVIANDIPCVVTLLESLNGQATIFCSPASDLPVGALNFIVSRLGVSGAPQTLGRVVARASVTDTSSSVTLATNAASLTVSGANFADPQNLDVWIFPRDAPTAALRCQIVNATQISAICNLPASSAAAWSGLGGPLQVNLTSYGGLASNINVAQLIAPPSITLSTETVPINETTLRISGARFASVNWPVQRSIVRVGYGNATENCQVQSESTENLIVCKVAPGTLSQNGSVVALVFAHSGWSTAPQQIAIVGNQTSSSVSAGFPAGGIAGIVIAILVVLVSVVLFLLLRARRMAARGKLDEEIAKMADDMRGMFNVKMSDVEVLDKLGEGSFGVVYLVHYKGRDCALKQLSATVLAAQLNEFFREASLQLSLKPHRNIVGTIGMSQERGRFSLLMELITNGALDSYLKNEGISPENPMNAEIFYRIGRGIAAGMRALSKQRVIHRDLAARNILLGDEFEPKVSDFGFSRVVNSEEGGIGKTASTVGPIRWMAPECISRQEYSEKTDVWAYGATLLEMLTGQEPYPGMQIMDIAVGVRDGKFTALDFLPASVQCPKFVREKILMRCFASDPEERPTFNDIVQVWNENVPAGMLIEYDEEDRGENQTNKTKKGGNNTATRRDNGASSSTTTNRTNKKTKGHYEEVMGDADDAQEQNESKKTRTNKTNRK